jgi:hypothetical protein
MAKIINITNKLSNEKALVVIGDEKYFVNDSMEAVLKFEELATDSSLPNLNKAIELALGKQAVKELEINKMSILNFKVITTAILAAMQDITYEEAEARFQGKE